MSTQYVTRTPEAAELAEIFGGPGSDLHANGHTVKADGARLIFSQAAVDFLRATRTANDDGYITGEADHSGSNMVLWIGGDPHALDVVVAEFDEAWRERDEREQRIWDNPATRPSGLEIFGDH